jgi:hypothetical protein
VRAAGICRGHHRQFWGCRGQIRQWSCSFGATFTCATLQCRAGSPRAAATGRLQCRRLLSATISPALSPSLRTPSWKLFCGVRRCAPNPAALDLDLSPEKERHAQNTVEVVNTGHYRMRLSIRVREIGREILLIP